MGERKQSELRRAENEVVFRQYNEKLERQADSILPPENHACECSNEECRTKLELPLTDYQRVHENTRHFVVAEGHLHADIEHTVEHHTAYDVVQKYEEPPETDGVLNKTH